MQPAHGGREDYPHRLFLKHPDLLRRELKVPETQIQQCVGTLFHSPTPSVARAALEPRLIISQPPPDCALDRADVIAFSY